MGMVVQLKIFIDHVPSCYDITGTKATADWNILKHLHDFPGISSPFYLNIKVRVCFRNSEVRHRYLCQLSNNVWNLIR